MVIVVVVELEGFRGGSFEEVVGEVVVADVEVRLVERVLLLLLRPPLGVFAEVAVVVDGEEFLVLMLGGLVPCFLPTGGPLSASMYCCGKRLRNLSRMSVAFRWERFSSVSLRMAVHW